jgi:hypothetical protein
MKSILHTFFFLGKFRGISWKNKFSKLFPRKIQFFSQHFWGKIIRGIFPKIFPGKKCTKNRTLVWLLVTWT